MDELLGQRPSIAPPVLIASIPEDTPGPHAVVGEQEGQEDDDDDEEEESQPGPVRSKRKRDRKDKLKNHKGGHEAAEGG